MPKVADLYAEFRGDTSQLKGAIKDASGQLDNFGKDIKGAESIGISSFANIASSIAAVVAVAKGIQEVFEFSAEGAKIASLESASRRLAISYEADMNKIVSSVKAASFDTITDYEAMKAANLAMTMGVSKNADEIANLMQIAIERGRAFGLTTEEAFDRITRGIGRMSPKILDDLGFNMKGITSQAEMLAAVLQQGNDQLAETGGLLMDVSTGYQRVTTAYQNFFNEIKMTAAYAFLPFVANKDEVENIYKEEAAIALISGTYKDYAKAYQQAQIAQGVGIGQKARFIGLIPTEEEFSLYKFQSLSKDVGKSFGNVGDGVGQLNNNVVQLQQNADKLMQDRTANWSINIRVNGAPATNLGGVFTNIGEDVNLWDLPSRQGMHGGSFIDMQHGGVVPPGFANDGMMVRVSSGERLDVTPAGNKSVSGESNSIKFYGPVTLHFKDKFGAREIMEQLQ